MLFEHISEFEPKDLALANLVDDSEGVEQVEVVPESQLLLSSLGFVLELDEALEGPEQVKLFSRGESGGSLLGGLLFLVLLLSLFLSLLFNVVIGLLLNLFFLLALLLILGRGFVELIHVELPGLELSLGGKRLLPLGRGRGSVGSRLVSRSPKVSRGLLLLGLIQIGPEGRSVDGASLWPCSGCLGL